MLEQDGESKATFVDGEVGLSFRSATVFRSILRKWRWRTPENDHMPEIPEGQLTDGGRLFQKLYPFVSESTDPSPEDGSDPSPVALRIPGDERSAVVRRLQKVWHQKVVRAWAPWKGLASSEAPLVTPSKAEVRSGNRKIVAGVALTTLHLGSFIALAAVGLPLVGAVVGLGVLSMLGAGGRRAALDWADNDFAYAANVHSNRLRREVEETYLAASEDGSNHDHNMVPGLMGNIRDIEDGIAARYQRRARVAVMAALGLCMMVISPIETALFFVLMLPPYLAIYKKFAATATVIDDKLQTARQTYAERLSSFLDSRVRTLLIGASQEDLARYAFQESRERTGRLIREEGKKQIPRRVAIAMVFSSLSSVCFFIVPALISLGDASVVNGLKRVLTGVLLTHAANNIWPYLQEVLDATQLCVAVAPAARKVLRGLPSRREVMREYAPEPEVQTWRERPLRRLVFDNVDFHYPAGKSGERGGVKINAEIPLPPGGVVGVIGSNSAGKSTLLKLIAGLLVPDETHGEVSISGLLTKQIPRSDLRRAIPYLPQEGGLLPQVTASQQLLLGDPGIEPREAEYLLNVFGVEPKHWQETPDGLSGGARRKTELAVFFAGVSGRDPLTKAIVLDEPTGGLDSERKEELANLLNQLTRNGLPVIVADHDMALMAQCEWSVVLDGGEFVAFGPTTTLYRMALNPEGAHELAIKGEGRHGATLVGDYLRGAEILYNLLSAAGEDPIK